MIEIILPDEDDEEVTVDQLKEEKEFHKKEIERIDKELEKRGVRTKVTPYMPKRRMSPYERTKAAVEATGNRWAKENFEATH